MDNELYMQMSTIVLNNWEVRIRLQELGECFCATTHLTPTSREGFGIEEELVSAKKEISYEQE